jgi:hypothetical protein
VHPVPYALAEIKFIPPSRSFIELCHTKNNLHIKACECVTNTVEPVKVRNNSGVFQEGFRVI